MTHDLDDLRAELDSYASPKKEVSRTPREERVIAGFEDIVRFIEENGRIPQHGEENDIFERIYAVRLDKIRASEECRSILKELDTNGLLEDESLNWNQTYSEIDDNELLSELGGSTNTDHDLTKLTHVKSRIDRKVAEEIAQRVPCNEFDQFKPLFLAVQDDLNRGLKYIKKCENKTKIEMGQFFILFGQTVYIAEIGDEFSNDHDRRDARLRVIFDNGTESNMLRTSLQRALYKDDTSRRITTPDVGPLFSEENEDGDIESGLIYVLRSKSDHPEIKRNYNVLHKIGVTGGSIEKRIADAKNDPTFLMADVEIVATYKLANINRSKLENLIHKFFEPARLNIEIKDRFGKPIVPREWYLVPRFIIDEAVEKIRSGAITHARYDANLGRIIDSEGG